MTCCRCNRTGRCQNCSCVKNGRKCQNCLALHVGNCVNVAQNAPAAQSSSTQPTNTDQPIIDSSTLSQSKDTPRKGSLRLPHNTLATPECATGPGSEVTCPAPDADSAASHQPHLPSSNQPATEATLSLPPFTPMATPTFCWGEYEAIHFIDLLNTTYKAAIHWKLNLFKIPYGTAGKAFT